MTDMEEATAENIDEEDDVFSGEDYESESDKEKLTESDEGTLNRTAKRYIIASVYSPLLTHCTFTELPRIHMFPDLMTSMLRLRSASRSVDVSYKKREYYLSIRFKPLCSYPDYVQL